MSNSDNINMENHEPASSDFSESMPYPQSDLLPVPDQIIRDPDWWRCLRRVPISGRYEGHETSSSRGRSTLDLRIDIDPRHANSPVMDKISGDLYKSYQFEWFNRVYRWQVYQLSWIVDDPKVIWSRCSVTITGTVRFWEGTHPQTKIHIVIPWDTFQSPGPAQVQFTVARNKIRYSCQRKSSEFRDVTLEVDICDSVNAAPILPTYDTHQHPNRPTSLPRRNLTVEEAYIEAGINLSINPNQTIIDDSHADFDSWSVAELHDAMEEHFSRYSSSWPNWHVWCLLAGQFDDPLTGGIMFDYWGAAAPPERQGCAVFRDHSWFDDLVSNPTNDDEAAAMRQFLYTYVHEIGHAFNFKHSWDKGRDDALSWMNYDWRYDDLPGKTDGDFWGNFDLRFDNEELIHLRHGNRASVIMGGDAWGSGGHLDSPDYASAELLGNPPIELLVRSKKHFNFLEPVYVELRLRNTTDLPVILDTQLNPEFGGVTIYIRQPNGTTTVYQPVLCQLAEPALTMLQPKDTAVEGEDRYSQNILVSYGANGHYFDVPGEYQIRAVYQGTGNVLILSNVFSFRIGQPYSREEDRIAQDFYSHAAGMALYLNGSSSPHIADGMNTLQEVSERFKDSAIGAQIDVVLAENLAEPFFRLNFDKQKVIKDRSAKPEEALSFTENALEQQSENPSTFTNLMYHRLRRIRADLLVQMGDKKKAQEELSKLVKDLKANGVNQSVLNEIESFAKTL